MATNLKKFLLAGTALVAGMAFSAQAHAGTQTVNGSDVVVGADPQATPAINYLTDNVATVTSGISLSTAGDTVTTGTTNFGTLTLAGGAQTVNGAVGVHGGNVLKLVNGGAAGGTSTFSSTVDATTVDLTGTGTLTATGNVTATTLNVNGAGTVNLNGATNTITTTNFAADGTVSLGSGASLTGALTTATTNTGTLTLAGGAQTVSGAVGTHGGNVLKTVNAGAAGGTSTFSSTVDATTVNLTGTGTLTATGDVTATTLNVNGAGTVNLNGAGANTITTTNFGADGTVSLADTANLTGAVTTATTNTGTLTLAGTTTVSGNVGAAGKLLKAVNAGVAGKTGTFSGLVDATTLTVSGTGNVALNGVGTNAITTTNFAADGVDTLGAGGVNLTGNVTTGANNTGTLTLAGASTVTGTVGTAANLLKVVNVGAAGTTSTFTGLVDATTLNVTGAAGVVNLNGAGANTITTLNFAADGTASLGAGANLTGAVTTALTNTGTLTLAGSSTVSGAVGTGVALLKTVNGGAAGATDVFSGAVNATTINVTGTGSEEFKAASAGALVFQGAAPGGTATIDSGINFTGSLNSTGAAVGAGVGNVVFSGASSTITTIGDTGILKTLTLNNPVAGTAVTVSTTGAVNAADTTNLGINTLTVGTTAGAFNLAGGQTLNSTYSAANAAGHVAAGANAANVAATSVINLSSVGAAGTYTLVSGTGGTINEAAAGDLKVNGVTDTLSGSNTFTAGLLSFHETFAADTLSIVATQNAVSSVAGLTTNDVSVGNALATVATNGNGSASLKAVITKLNSAGTAAQLHADYQSLTPAVDGGAEQVAFDLGSETQDIFDTRLASLRSGDTSSGVAAGASAQGVSVWFEGYGQHANQRTRDSVDGYSSNTGGGAIGADTKSLGDDTVVGFALNYGLSKIDSKNANTTTTDVDNYGLNFYGTYILPEKSFINGQAGYAYNKITSDRHNADLAGDTAHGDRHADQYTLKVDGGHDYPLADATGLILTPDVFTDYTRLKTLGYTESGAGGADLAVSGQSISAWDLGLGVNAGWKIKTDDGDVVKPGVHAKYGYDLLNDNVQTASSFVGDPASTVFITSGAKPARSTYDFGAGVVYATTADWDFSANYDFKYKQDYRSSTGEIRATAHF